jgi:peptidyl-prolyl cis-trans isomerase SurA
MNARDLSGPRAAALWLALTAAAMAPATALAQLRAPTPADSSPRVPAASVPSASGPRAADYIVAIVNSEPITNSDVRARLTRVEQQIERQGSKPPPRAELARQVLERLIGERAQLQLARDNGIRVDDAMIDAAEQNVARQNQMPPAEFRQRLAAEGVSLDAFRADLRNQLLLQRLRDREIEPRVKVTEQEIDQYIREQQNAPQAAGVELNLAHVLVAVPENAPAPLVNELRAKAAQVQQRARAGEEFAALAREFSDAPGAAETGGALGLRTADRYPPQFVQATQALKAGGVSEIVRSGAGFHVIKVLEKREGAVPGMSVVQNHARHILLRPGPQLSESAARDLLAEYKRRIAAGQADFAQLAREHSQDASARNGGDLGWASPGMFVPEFEEVMNSLAPGQIADPVLSRFGVHLIQLLERRQQTLSAREQREVVRNLLREKKLEEAYVRWAQDVRGRAYVELREPPQ